MSAVKLHHVHVSPQATRLQFDQPRQMTWRADGAAPLPLKRDVARRLAVCWNVLEGIPTEALESGVLLEICEAIDAGDMERAKRALAQLDAASEDTADGKPHACEACR